MNIKKITLFALIMVFLSTIFAGCDKYDMHFLSYDEITDIYNANKELINSIKDGLFSSGFIPHDGMTPFGYDSRVEKSVFLHYDYEKKQLFCSDDAQGEKLKSIQNVHNDAIEYFMSVDANSNPSIAFRKIRYIDDTIIEFAFRSNYKKEDYRAGIIYTITPNEPWGEVHLEDNWYAYKYTMD